MTNTSQQLEPQKSSAFSGLQNFSKALRRIVKNRYLNMLIGVILIVVSGDEVWNSFAEGFQVSNLDSNFGIVVIGISHILKALPDLLEGIEHMEGKDESPAA